MKRFRLSTLMLLVVIAALGSGMIAQEIRHRQREAEQQVRLAVQMQTHEMEILIMKQEAKGLQAKLNRLARSSSGVEGADAGK
jgi:hypothetical protein